MNKSRGDVSIYIALLLLGAMLSTSIVLQLVISRQGKYTTNVLSSERAIYAANSGLEQMLKTLPGSVEAIISGPICVSGEVEYSDHNAQYEAWGKIDVAHNSFCIYSKGSFQGLTRYLSTGESNCVGELISASSDVCPQ
jgi:hypothetical protein